MKPSALELSTSRGPCAGSGLKQIGRRKLLKARDEQEIGARIERTRGDLLAALGSIPAARRTLLALADCVRQGSAPAAELILLPDGGELKPENVEPVLRALTRVRTLETRIDRWLRHCADRRSTAASRERFRREIGRADTAMGAILRNLPIRPSVVDDLVQELTRLEHEFAAMPGIAGNVTFGPKQRIERPMHFAEVTFNGIKTLEGVASAALR